MDRPLEPLWRGLLVYRVLTLVSTSIFVLVSLREYAHPLAAGLVVAVMVVWTVVTGFAYFPRRDGPDRRGTVAAVDLVVTAAVMLTTPIVQSPAQLAGDTPLMGSIWTPGAALALAIAFGLRGGLLGAVVIAGALVAVTLTSGPMTLVDLADVQLLILAGLTVGFCSGVLRRSAERVRAAVAEQAAATERERLARSIHDGVLQVLAHVRRRGTELGGGAGELGTLAGEQEVVLRTLLTSGTAAVDGGGRRDLAAALRTLASTRVSVSAPAHPLDLPAHVVDDLLGVVGAALANTVLHVGVDAPAWVFVEDLGREVEISVRDDGPGIPDGRLAEAEAEGRLGVAASMRGRVRDLGGTLVCETGPGRGTEWTMRVART
ncbi:MAG: histidine kinase [Pseudonocardia sp. SCN 72-86]|nr:MAG: histidine kinase [Pseudonocardia sp. SCN 72-86]